MLATGGESRLDLKDAPVVSVGRWHGREGGQALGQGLVVVGVPSRVAELERHRGAQAHQPCRGQRRERRNHRRLRQASEDARVGEIAGPRHLPVGAPSRLRGVEVEPPLLAQDCDEFKSTLGVHDLSEGGVDGLAQRPGSEDGSRLTLDILIDFDRGLRHVARMSR